MGLAADRIQAVAQEGRAVPIRHDDGDNTPSLGRITLSDE
jgi:hypothetical protein